MTTLVIRPAKEADALVLKLNQAGHPALAQALLTQIPSPLVSDLPSKLSSLTKRDFLIAVSAPAVEMAHNYLMENGLSWASAPTYLAVGEKTARQWQALSNQSVLYPKQRADSEGLLALPCLHDLTNAKAVILRGNGGREHLFETLHRRGARVSYCETYQRKWLPLEGRVLIPHWQQQNVQRVVITSGEQIERLYQLTPTEDRPWLCTRQLLVPSPRLQKLAQTLGFTDIYTVGSANNLALFSALINMG